jgi:AcrR family transcriptional regulator
LSPKIIDKEAKKMEIIHAAIQVFARKGLVKTKMTDIAEAAGIGKGTIYEYFRSKDEIFQSGFKKFFSEIEQDISKVTSATDNPVEQMRLLVSSYLKTLYKYGSEHVSIIMHFWAEGIRTQDQEMLDSLNIGRIYEDYRRAVRAVLENGIRKGIFKPVNTFYASAVFIAAFDGILLQWILDHELIDFRKAASTMMEVLLNGFLKERIDDNRPNRRS